MTIVTASVRHPERKVPISDGWVVGAFLSDIRVIGAGVPVLGVRFERGR